MKVRKVMIGAAVLLLCSTVMGCNGQSQTPPQAVDQQPAVKVEVEVKQDHSWTAPSDVWTYEILNVTATVDSVVVNSIDMNRGHCRDENNVKFPVRLVFGQQISLMPSCSLIEAVVNTDQGSWTVTFSKKDQ